MEFRILGPFKAVEDGRTVPNASSRQRALLALLVLHANEPLSADRIVDELWGDSPPGSGAKAVAFHVSRLRRALATQPGCNNGRPILATTPAGYVLRTEPDAIDAFAAERLGREGEELLPEQPAKARERLVSALGLWHGEALSDLAYEPFAQQEIERLSELRRSVARQQGEAMVRCAPWSATTSYVCGAREIRWIVSTRARSTLRRWLAPPSCRPVTSHGVSAKPTARPPTAT